MSKALPITVALVLSGFALSPIACAKHDDQAPKTEKSTTETKKSENPAHVMAYTSGYQLGAQIPADMDVDQIAAGMRDAKAKKQATYSEAEVMTAAQAYQKQMDEKLQKESQGNDKFLADNAKKPEIKTTASGLQYQILKEGTGKAPTATSTVKVNYEGKLINGTVFDSSFERKQPIEFPLNQVIPGWTEGLPLLKEGGSMMLYVPPKLGYGSNATGSIPANSVLIFKIDLIEVK